MSTMDNKIKLKEDVGLSGGEEPNICASVWVMTECREFLKRTFSFLTARELNVCARVCRVWQTDARWILSKRFRLHWVTDFKSLHTPMEQISHPLGFFGQNLEEKLQSMGSQPRFALMLTEYSKGADYRCSGENKNNKPKKAQQVIDFIKDLLPRDCLLLSLMTPGSVGPRSSETTKPGDESESCGGALCALFPSMPGVRIQILPVSPQLLQSKDKDTLWERWIEAGISPSDTQCILLFGWGVMSGVQHVAVELQRLFQENAQRNPVIAGAIVGRLLSKELCSAAEQSSGVIGVTFSGPNVRAASVLLGEQAIQREDAKNAVSRLREANLHVNPKHSLGFMFACAGRGSFFYNDQNVESEEFHRTFPDTPLFGLFGGGEIGCLNLTGGQKIERVSLSSVVHAYTTIMCLLTFDPS